MCGIILYTIWIHLTPWRTYIWPHNNQLVLSIYCLVSTVSCLHLDSTLLRGAEGCPLFLCDQNFWPSAVAGHVVVVRHVYHVWIFVYVSTLLVVRGGSPFSLLESFCISRYFLRVSSTSLPTADYVQVVKPGMRNIVVTTAYPFHLWRTVHCGIPRKSALQISTRLHHAHTPFWSGSGHHCWFPSKLASVPEALNQATLWRVCFWKVLPLSLSVPLLRRGNHFFQFRRAQRVPLVALAPLVIWRQAEAESSILVKVDWLILPVLLRKK